MGGKIGPGREVNCESDFVARTDQFAALVKKSDAHRGCRSAVRAAEDVPAEALDKEREIYHAQFAQSGKPANVIDKIVDGKLAPITSRSCCWIRSSSATRTSRSRR